MKSNYSLKFAEKNARQRPNRESRRAAPHKRRKIINACVSLVLGLFAGNRVFADEAVISSQPRFDIDSCRSVWTCDVGDGFRKHATEVGISGGYGIGLLALASEQRHDLVLADVHIGTMLSGLVAKDHFWRGNWELLGQLFGGEQIKPRNAYVVGAAPLLRYNFATGTRLVPFITGGAGVSLTDIRHPDLGSDFEFNLQGGVGAHWFFKRNVSAMLEGRWLHLSNAGIDEPNNGVNTIMIYLGANWFF